MYLMSIIQLNNNLIDWFNDTEHSATYTFEHDGSILVPSAFGDLCLRLTRTLESLYQVAVTDKKQLNEVIFSTTDLPTAENYIKFIVTRKVNPDYLNNYDPNETLPRCASSRFLQQGTHLQGKLYNSVSWISDNERKTVYFRASNHNDLRIHNHIMKYVKYVEDSLSSSKEQG